MFRKTASARRDWNKNLVKSCAFRQFSILKSAVKMLKPGGSLVYSTCTFNPIENETVIGRLLEDQPELEIVERPRLAGASPARSDWAILDSHLPELSRADRIWPHSAPGEGHFVAMLCRKPSSHPQTNHSTRKQYHNRTFGEFLSKPQMRCVLDFWQENIRSDLFTDRLTSENRLRLVGSYIYHISENLPDLSSLRVIHPGWWIGTLHSSEFSNKLRFEPSQSLAMGLDMRQVQHSLNLPSDSREIFAYLHGKSLAISGGDGWVLVCTDGFPIGWGKLVAGTLKNCYPRGLRWS